MGPVLFSLFEISLFVISQYPGFRTPDTVRPIPANHTRTPGTNAETASAQSAEPHARESSRRNGFPPATPPPPPIIQTAARAASSRMELYIERQSAPQRQTPPPAIAPPRSANPETSRDGTTPIAANAPRAASAPARRWNQSTDSHWFDRPTRDAGLPTPGHLENSVVTRASSPRRTRQTSTCPVIAQMPSSNTDDRASGR